MHGKISIRLVDAWDETEILHLYRAGGWWKDEYDPKGILPLIRGSFVFAVAVDELKGHAVGMGRVLSDGVSDGYIQDLVVLPEYRRQGVGKEIVAALVEACRKSGIAWIGLIAEPDTERFYLPLGFHPMTGHAPLLWNGDP